MAKLHYNDAVEAFRDQEYPMLKDSIYLDHAGSTLCSKSLMDAFATEMTSVLYGNPHSASSSSQLSASRIEDVRLHLLRFFKADPTQYDLVFVSNATAGVKLVVEGLRSLPQGYCFAYHEACHTSLIGAREESQQNICLSDIAVRSWLKGESPFMSSVSKASATLFAYSAQSHMNGRRYPLTWSKDVKKQSQDASSPIFTLLDVASLAATSQLDLSDPQLAPDFVVLSLYKIFGFPDLGTLIVRRSAESIWDNRKYFGGGTVDMVLCGKEQWHVSKSRSLHERLEDGTLPFHSIMAIDIALKTQIKLFGSMDRISFHTAYLRHELFHGLCQLRHWNGEPVCTMYTEPPNNESSAGSGPVVSFNIRDSGGSWIGLAELEKLTILKKIHIRTGGLCSPAGIASALDLQPWEMRNNLSSGFKCGEDTGTSSIKPTGVIRASLGAMSTKSDVHLFVDFVKEFFAENEPDPPPKTDSMAEDGQPSSGLRVRTITVFPIKSCGGFKVPPGVGWEVRAEGLAWDREWCLIHRGSGQALSQKRYPKMALLRPSLIFDKDILRVKYHGEMVSDEPGEVDIPLSADPSLFDSNFRQTSSRVCGEEISAQAYISEDINNFFTDALGVPCVLARFPPGGHGSSSRSSKAQMQKHQKRERVRSVFPGSLPDMPSPPDSDSEQQKQKQLGKILLSNESPILMVHAASISMLNKEIEYRGGDVVSQSAFRANIVIENAPGHDAQPPYSEDFWGMIHIGSQDFKLLGACQRCQMVCVDQETGERKQEPFVTLAKTRRFDGKVYFGAHMRHDPGDKPCSPGTCPTIKVGDFVSVNKQYTN
ncbi:Molybdenum cofactor sulfurase [Cladobotryum mycophilum]|uniref:Molybdenum cofactor sulfurase n=1 Tax=Cladobotryum mycophilum TaxID=491253 RepID=A0ABR0SGJ5_9HYPO